MPAVTTHLFTIWTEPKKYIYLLHKPGSQGSQKQYFCLEGFLVTFALLYGPISSLFKKNIFVVKIKHCKIMQHIFFQRRPSLLNNVIMSVNEI